MIYNKNLLSNAVKIISINHINIKNVPSRKRSLSSVINLKTFPSQSFSYLLEKILSLSLLISFSNFFYFIITFQSFPTQNNFLSIIPFFSFQSFTSQNISLSIVPFSNIPSSIVHYSKHFPFNCSSLIITLSIVPCSNILFSIVHCSKHFPFNCSPLKTFSF